MLPEDMTMSDASEAPLTGSRGLDVCLRKAKSKALLREIVEAATQWLLQVVKGSAESATYYAIR